MRHLLIHMDDDLASSKPDLVIILIVAFTGAFAIDHQEISGFESNQRMMPCSRPVVDALAAVGDEGSKVGWLRFYRPIGNHDKKRGPPHGNKGLA